MMNNKGQTLAIFVIFLPLLIILLAGVYEVGSIYYEKNKLDNINVIVIKYGIKNIKDKIQNLISKNDKKIKINKINITNNDIEINLEKRINTTFSKIIGIKHYDIKSYYIGNEKEIKKG